MDLRSMRARSAEKRRWRFRRKAGPVPENPLWLRPMPSKTCALRSDRGTQRNSPRTPAGQGSLAMMRLLTRPRSSLLAIWGRLGAQPQRDVGGLHRLPHHPYQVVAQCLKVSFIAQLHREPFERLGCVVFAPVEATVYETLRALPQRSKKGCYQEGRGHDREGGLLAREGDEGSLHHDDTAEVNRDQHYCERPIDQRAIDDPVYVVESVAQDRYPYSDRNRRYKGYDECKPHSLEPEWCVYYYGDEVRKAGGNNVPRSSVSEPLDLLALHSYGTSQSHEHR